MNPSHAPVPPPFGAELEQLRGMLALLEQSIAALDAVCSGALDNPWRVVASAARARDVLLECDASHAAVGAAELRALSSDLADTLSRAR